MTATAARATCASFSHCVRAAESRKSPQNSDFYGHRTTYSEKAHCIKDSVLLDPAAGTGGMLAIGSDYLKSLNQTIYVDCYGQELNPMTYAVCKSDMLIKGQQYDRIYRGNSFTEDGTAGKTFSYMLCNPPFGVEWKKYDKFIKEENEKLGFAGRFGAGLPRISDGSFLFLQHMISKMKPVDEGGSRILKHVEPNDFVISMRSFQGGIEWSGLRGKISSAYVMLIPDQRLVYSPFFKWLLKSDKYIRALQSTSNLVRDGQALRYSNFKQVNLPIISLDEQKQISDYLDMKTSQMDGLIQDISSQLALLKEYRQSVISEAVTGKVAIS